VGAPGLTWGSSANALPHRRWQGILPGPSEVAGMCQTEHADILRVLKSNELGALAYFRLGEPV
jgi:hypothetical protein